MATSANSTRTSVLHHPRLIGGQRLVPIASLFDRDSRSGHSGLSSTLTLIGELLAAFALIVGGCVAVALASLIGAAA